jgi:hypothetical protein
MMMMIRTHSRNCSGRAFFVIFFGPSIHLLRLTHTHVVQTIAFFFAPRPRRAASVLIILVREECSYGGGHRYLPLGLCGTCAPKKSQRHHHQFRRFDDGPARVHARVRTYLMAGRSSAAPAILSGTQLLQQQSSINHSWPTTHQSYYDREEEDKEEEKRKTTKQTFLTRRSTRALLLVVGSTANRSRGTPPAAGFCRCGLSPSSATV